MMRVKSLLSYTAVLGLLAAAGCATPDLPMVTGEGWESSSRFRKLFVLPFTDGKGQGKQLAAAAAAELARSGYDVVEPTQAEHVLRRLRLEEGEALSLATLADIRAATYADAVVIGSLASDGKSVAALAVETREGDVVASVRAKAPFGRVFEHYEEAARAAAQALAGAGRRSAVKTSAPPIDED